ASGEIHVYRMPNAARERDASRPHVEVSGARVVILAPMGRVLADVITTGGTPKPPIAPKQRLQIPIGAERVVVVAGAAPSDFAGFVSGTRLAQIGRKTLLGAGCVVDSSSLRVRRFTV